MCVCVCVCVLWSPALLRICNYAPIQSTVFVKPIYEFWYRLMCVCVCARACARACLCACARACARARARVCAQGHLANMQRATTQKNAEIH